MAIRLQHSCGLAQVRLKVLHMLCAQQTVALVQQCSVRSCWAHMWLASLHSIWICTS